MAVRRVAAPRLGAAVAAVLVVLLGATGFLPGSAPPARGAPGSLVLRSRTILAPGVEHLRYATQSPLNVIHVAKVRANAPVAFSAVLSKNRVVGDATSSGLETTSSMCGRTGALVCVNGDFTACSGCTAPLGGVIRNGEVLRTPHPAWPQVSFGTGGPSSRDLAWSGFVRAAYRWEEPAVPGVTDDLVTVPESKVVDLPLTGVNVSRGSSGVVLMTPAYATSTRTEMGGFEVAFSANRRASLGVPVYLTMGAASSRGNVPIPTNGFVLSAAGSGADKLRAFWTEARRHPDRLEAIAMLMSASQHVSQSLGGHPVILTGGQPLPPPAPTDAASRVRHPRTVIGWNTAGDAWLVTIDGRQPGRSVGATFWEAADVLRQLGATEGINLDGGGSTTFVARECWWGRLCVRNRPSDGRERAVTTALAVVPRR